MRKSSLLLLLIIAITQFSCENVEEKLVGSWTIESLEAPFDIINNTFFLKKDNTCRLPISDFYAKNTTQRDGTWSAYKEDNKVFLVISSDNKKFEGTYEVSNYKRVLDKESFGYLIKITFSKKDVILNCVKAEY